VLGADAGLSSAEIDAVAEIKEIADESGGPTWVAIERALLAAWTSSSTTRW